MKRLLCGTALGVLVTLPAYAMGDDEAIRAMITGTVVAAVVFLPFAIAIYLLPYFIGRKRDISMRGWLLFVNVFLGWTLLVWCVCLLWAVLGTTKAQERRQSRAY